MKKERQTLKVFSIMFLLSIVHASLAQDQSTTLQQDFDALMENSNTYEQYKVIPIQKLNGFWMEAKDSLQTKDRNNLQLKGKIIGLESMIDSLNSELGDIKTQLGVSEETNEEIAFIGIPFNKTVYHFIVWGIIIVVTVIAVITYFMYVRSNGLTSRYKKDLELLRKEYEAHRDKAREDQVRLKRDLQTAVNSIEDMKRGGARR